MKSFIFLIQILFIYSIGFAQYSDYYNINHNINVSGTVNKNINVSGNVRKTVTTIDYGALAHANALKESNRITQQNLALEQARYRDDKERSQAILYAQRALEIASDPLKAHQYGTYSSGNLYATVDEWIKNYGFLSFSMSATIPHTSLFEYIGGGDGHGRLENISYEGITTEFITMFPVYYHNNPSELNSEQIEERQAWYKRLNEYYVNNDKPRKKNYKQNKEQFKIDLKRYVEICDSLDNSHYVMDFKESVRIPHLTEGEMFEGAYGDSAYLHKKELVKRIVYGKTGFRSTLIWEDEFEICITDSYLAINSEGIRYSGKVRYKADKNSSVTFEELEGRRFYLSKLVDKYYAAFEIDNVITRPPDKYQPKRRSYSSSQEYDEAVRKFNTNLNGSAPHKDVNYGNMRWQ